jgi:uncharacterized protein YoxC
MTEIDQKFINSRLDALHNDIHDMRQAMRDLSAAITKLALVEERLVQTSASIDRAFKAVEKIADRVSALEKSGIDSLRISRWVDRAVWGVMAAMGVYLLKALKVL